MVTKLSTKGQVVVPQRIRRKLDLQPGDTLEAKLDGQSIVLTPHKRRACGVKIVPDEITGLPVLKAAPGTPRLTNAQVREILDEFP
ncbi:MAG TPA: AbrB/MazE/SpoVT family DNA-binding domain-containing protein [Candidatus Acidoferrales bacterium]|nr:AbrB/MazE/SpoVT family DNA-binding domain-containing protein [Candidatus Acidoferrales bacterium]